jgi:nucleoside-triphosphatase THEP1
MQPQRSSGPLAEGEGIALPAAGPGAGGVASPSANGEVTPLRQATWTPERVPWSELAPDFISTWGYPNGKFEPEHVEILGPTGSGKTYFEATILQERVHARDSGVVFIATKPADKTITQLGWEIVNDWSGIKQHRQVIFWPRTKLIGTKRRDYMAAKIEEVLGNLWVRNSANIVVFDEIATAEALSPDLREMIKMYWREARSVGITIVAMKQRPQGVQRDMHSEASWTVSFHPKDEDDALRYAEVLGSKRQWLPVLSSLDRDKHEFVIKYERTGDALVSWVDIPLKPAKTEKRPYERRN